MSRQSGPEQAAARRHAAPRIMHATVIGEALEHASNALLVTYNAV
jgi:hypothetical protein